MYIVRGVPAPRNGRGRRECWRAATRRLRPCGGSPPFRGDRAAAGVGDQPSPTAGIGGESSEERRRQRTWDWIARSGVERWWESRGTFSLPDRRAIMSARSPDWRSGANPSGVGLDAFSDATRARAGLLARSLAFARSPCSPLRRTYPHRAAPCMHTRELCTLRSLVGEPGCVPTAAVLRVLTASTPINTTLRRCFPTRAGAWGTKKGCAIDVARCR